MTPEKNDATVLLRLPSDLKAALTREAFINGRRITAEINMRLASSLADSRHATPAPSATGERVAYTTNYDKELQEALAALSAEQKQALVVLLRRKK